MRMAAVWRGASQPAEHQRGPAHAAAHARWSRALDTDAPKFTQRWPNPPHRALQHHRAQQTFEGAAPRYGGMSNRTERPSATGAAGRLLRAAPPLLLPLLLLALLLAYAPTPTEAISFSVSTAAAPGGAACRAAAFITPLR